MKKPPPPYLSYSHYADDALAASILFTPAPFLAPATPPSNCWSLAIVSRQFKVFA
jgi:hypothetical protein